MSSKGIDFSDLGGKPVAQTGGIDFSDLGGKKVGQVPQEQLDQIQALNQNPTEFEKANTPFSIKQYLSDFVNKPLFPSMAEKHDQAAQLEQQQLNQIYGPEAEQNFKGIPKILVGPAKQIQHLGTIPTSAARVAYGAGSLSPMDATVVAASTMAGQPELAAGYFTAKGATELPGAIKNAVQNPSPENVEGALGTGAMVAGGASGMKSGLEIPKPWEPMIHPPTVESTGARTATGINKLGEVGRLRQTARQITGIEPEVKSQVQKVATRQERLNETAAQKNQANQAAHEADLQRVAEENKAAEQTLGLRQQTEAELAGKTKDYYAKEDAAEKAADEKNQANWNAWRAKVADATVDMAPVKATIDRVSAKFPEAKAILDETTATPEDMTAANAQFIADRSAVMKQQGYGTDYDSLPAEARAKVDDLVDRLGLKPDETVPLDTSKPMSLQRLHDLKTQIGWKLFRGEFPPPVQGAMKQVYKSLKQAEARGSLENNAVPEYEAGLQSHQDYEQAFGRSKPNRSYEGELRKKEANPEAYSDQQEQQRLAAAAKVEPSIPGAYQEVAGLREKVKALPTEEQLRKSIQQPPEAPKPVEPKQLGVDIQRTTQKAIADRAKNWGSFNARDIGIIGSSVLAAPLLYFLGSEIGHGGGASALAPAAALAYEGTKFAASRALNNQTIVKWLSKTPKNEIQALSHIPGADGIKIRDGMTQVAVDSARYGKPVTLSPEAASFLGPANVAKIMAAAGSGVSKSPGDLKKKAQELSGQ